MAKARQRKLKVFQTQLGFYDSVVAASSKAAALRAWGIRRDLFAQGLADIATDEAAVEAALACPDIALKRPTGSDQPFTLAPGRPKVSDVDPGGQDVPDAQKPSAAFGESPRKPPDRSRLDAAEAALKALDGEHDHAAARLKAEFDEISAEEESLRKRKALLAAEQSEIDEGWKSRRAELAKAVSRERRNFRLGGGRDQ